MIRMTKQFKRPVLMGDEVIRTVTKLFERPDAFNKRVTKLFERADVFNKRVTKLFKWVDVSS